MSGSEEITNCIQSQLDQSEVNSFEKASNKTGVDISMGTGADCQGHENIPAVYIRHLCKRYGNGPPVLQNFSMNVRKGSIYGLLGSSGCGKTTILSCIVGLRKWDSGNVLVFGKTPGTKESGIPGKILGYMPQELALYNQLTIREVIQFYGRIYDMSDGDINERWGFLNKLLKLPTEYKLVGKLSGGQRRRASLALALIHSPDLLILDEPTVGLDPLLRRKIWKYLFKIVGAYGTTILITTHYIEEARFSNTIGLMRNGKLLAEDSPSRLLQLYNCQLLENVVLQLCRQDEMIVKDGSSSSEIISTKHEQDNEMVLHSDKNNRNIFNGRKKSVINGDKDEFMNYGVFRNSVSFDCDVERRTEIRDETKMSKTSHGLLDRIRETELYRASRRIYGLVMVIHLMFIRYPWFLAMLLWIPSIQGTLTLWTCASPPREMHLGIVNHELANWTYLCDLPKHSNGNSCDLSELSCKYVNYLKRDDTVILKEFQTEEEALADVQQGKSWGYLTFSENYTQHSIDLAAAKQFAGEDSIEGSRVRLHLDYSHYLAAFLLVKHLMLSYQGYISELVESCDFGGRELELPLFFRTPVYGNNDDDYTEFIMPGVILCSLFGIVSSLTALLVIGDRKQGTLSRAHVAGLGTVNVIIAHLITQGIVTLFQIVIWKAVLHFLFDLEIRGSLWLALLICLLVGIAGAGLGLVAAVICENEIEGLYSAILLVPVFMLYGGAVYPMETFAYKFSRFVGSILPVGLPTISLRAVVANGLGLSHPLVWPGLLALVAWVVILPVLSVLIYRKSGY